MTAVGDARKRTQEAASPQVDPDATATPVGAQGGDLDAAGIRARHGRLVDELAQLDEYPASYRTIGDYASLAGAYSAIARVASLDIPLLLAALDEARAEVQREISRADKNGYQALALEREKQRLSERAAAEILAAESSRDAAEGALRRIESLAQVQAISCQAQHRADHARNWLDVLAIIERAALDPAVPATEGGEGQPCRECGKSPTACGKSREFCCDACSESRFRTHDPIATEEP